MRSNRSAISIAVVRSLIILSLPALPPPVLGRPDPRVLLRRRLGRRDVPGRALVRVQRALDQWEEAGGQDETGRNKRNKRVRTRK